MAPPPEVIVCPLVEPPRGIHWKKTDPWPPHTIHALQVDYLTGRVLYDNLKSSVEAYRKAWAKCNQAKGGETS